MIVHREDSYCTIPLETQVFTSLQLQIMENWIQSQVSSVSTEEKPSEQCECLGPMEGFPSILQTPLFYPFLPSYIERKPNCFTFYAFPYSKI